MDEYTHITLQNEYPVMPANLTDSNKSPWDKIWRWLINIFAGMGIMATVITLCLWWGYTYGSVENTKVVLDARGNDPRCDGIPASCCMGGALPANCRSRKSNNNR